ncbi:acyl-CoA desaturase [Laspinema sp. D1]|uniref:Acyl-CoA desaturase n=1 Tax=Laspinema palackyanum D2a TaxID=2953684 RepID=A0ABT2ML15_9CYAN|nr:acyl-CoA desaturase [Laspinema sp. D2a]
MTGSKVTFAKNKGFWKELNRRVEAYFEAENIPKRDCPQMYLKTLTLVLWMVGAYSFTLFGPAEIGFKILGCMVLAAGIAGFAFCVGHDANHGGYSNHKWLNKSLGLTYDAIGLSSYLWRFRHNYLHHTYTNILGHDVEIHGDGLVRMSPDMPHKWYHKFQHLFIWFIYPLIPVYWSFCDVQIILFKRKYHDHVVPTPSPMTLATLLVGKLVWLGLFIGIPLAVGYSPLTVIGGFLLTYFTYGAIICEVFMMAHVMDNAEFITPDPEQNHVDDEWAIFQVRTTVDFAPNNPFCTWYMGGLNFQVVHHLYPHICHIHYPELSKILMGVCEEFGVKYQIHETLTGAMISNFNWLKAMSVPPKPLATPTRELASNLAK